MQAAARTAFTNSLAIMSVRCSFLASSCPVIPVSGEANQEDRLWGVYRTCGDQGSGGDERGFACLGRQFHRQVYAYSPLADARNARQAVKGNPRNSQMKRERARWRSSG